jgi:hypothetical protein
MTFSRIGFSYCKAMSAMLLTVASLAGPTDAEVTAVWALGDNEKVFRYDANHPLRERNTVWDGKSIRLIGLKNEPVG